MQPVKPILLLQLRPEDDAAADEHRSFCDFGGLQPHEVVAVRMERDGVPEVTLADWSAVIVGGGPSNISDDLAGKPGWQLTFERQLFALLDDIVERDFPFLGSCYGMGALAAHQGGVVSRRYPEPVGATRVTLTPDAAADPLTADLPRQFEAFVGHKESCEALPPAAVLLASSADCPVQMLRVGRNVYATQFHAELDADALARRILVYRHAGYFPPEQAEELIVAGHRAAVTQPVRILRRFVDRYTGRHA
ncbi:MAG: putative glutamine amidotransferase [Frankiales bacterium]|nr:putative glutamine amidotransferase [Frankiales bacterium]